jgi:hypothetical protein
MSGILLAFVGGSYGKEVLVISGAFAGAPFASTSFCG